MKKKILAFLILLTISAVGIVVIGAEKDKEKPNIAVEHEDSPADIQIAALDTKNASIDNKDFNDDDNCFNAIEHASEANKHLFIFFYENDSEQTRTIRKTFESAMKKIADDAQWVAVDRNSPSEKEIVEKFQVQTAPMPLVIALAPNGAVTGGFLGQEMNEEKLQGSLASPCMQKCLKALQERKLVFLCAQNKDTKFNVAAMRGVNGFKSDPQFVKFTEIITIDPADEAEKKFIKQLKIDSEPDEAITAFMAPPGMIIGKFEGATNKDMLLATLQRAMASCGTGCGPRGCAP